MRFSYIFVVVVPILLSGWTAAADSINDTFQLRQKLKHIAEELEAEDTIQHDGEKIKVVAAHHHHNAPSELQDMVPYANDDCFGAINLDDFIGRPYNDNGLTSPLSDIPNCMVPYTISGGQIRGRWFRVTGTGNTMTASTCGYATFDTVMQVFSGFCEGLQCVAQNDDDPNCGTPNRSTVTFPTNPGTLYYMLVYGYESAGSFEILVTEETTPQNSNNQCVNAQQIGNFAMLDDQFTTATDLSGLNSCGSASATSAGGAWYRVTLNGGGYADTCSYAEFDTQISIYRGSCSNLQCVDGNNDGCGSTGTASKISWTSNGSETFWILVHGRNGGYGYFDFYYSGS